MLRSAKEAVVPIMIHDHHEGVPLPDMPNCGFEQPK